MDASQDLETHGQEGWCREAGRALKLAFSVFEVTSGSGRSGESLIASNIGKGTGRLQVTQQLGAGI